MRTLDPTIGNDEILELRHPRVYDTLVDYEPADPARPGIGLALVPHLAASWEVSPDHLDYVFTLRDGLVYSDGTPIRAADFKTSLDRALHPASPPFASYLVDVKDVRVPDDRHVRARALAPVRRLPLRDGDVVRDADPAGVPRRGGDELRRAPLASGPCVLVRWDEGEHLVLRKNPRYWDAARVHLDAIELCSRTSRATPRS